MSFKMSPAPARMDSPAHLYYPPRIPGKELLAARLKMFQEWHITELLTTCIQLLRYQNRTRGSAELDLESIKTVIHLTLRPLFNGLETMENINLHFEKFVMPAFDRYLYFLDNGTGHDWLMYAYDCIASGNINFICTRIPYEDVTNTHISFAGMQGILIMMSTCHRDFLLENSIDGTARPRTQDCALPRGSPRRCYITRQLTSVSLDDLAEFYKRLGITADQKAEASSWLLGAGL